jgi:low affinity Fe/Cu permease
MFSKFAIRVADLVGSSAAFFGAVIVIAAWAITGPIFGYSDTWQLWINTGTTIVTFLMVFVIQHTQNRDSRSLHLKLDELLRAVHGTHAEMMNLKDLSDEELRRLEQTFDRLAQRAAQARSAKRAKVHEHS